MVSPSLLRAARSTASSLMLGRPIGWALKAVHVRSDAEAAALEDARKDVLEAGLRRTPRWPHGCGSWTAALS
jgi:hypothetical protein